MADEAPAELERQGQELRHTLRVQEAIQCYERALAKEPGRASAHVGLGYCHMDLRDYEKALRCFEAAMDSHPDDRTEGQALYGAAIALTELGRLDEAASYARRQASLGDRENRSRGLYSLGLVDYARGAFRAAAANLEESLNLAPERRASRRRPAMGDLRHRYVLAQCYRELNEPSAALPHLEWVVRHAQSPTRAARAELAHLYLENHQADKAEREYLGLLRDQPDDPIGILGMGRVCLDRHDYDGAARYFHRVLAKARDDVDALGGLADAYKGKGDLDRAAGYLEQIRQRHRVPERQLERRLHALQLERERRDAELLRVRNIAALNLMATGIAHELRQPLSVIRLAAQNARRDLARGDHANLAEDLQDIDANVTRLNQVVELLREAASEEQPPEDDVELGMALDAALLLFQAQLKIRDIALEIHGLQGVRVRGDRIGLQQVFMNLVSNARDALVDAKEKKISIWAVPDTSHVWVYVKDTGCGMTADVRDRAMEPFFTTKQNHGTGVGLYICFNLLRRMNGALRIKDTAPGQGTTIELELPRAVAEVEQ